MRYLNETELEKFEWIGVSDNDSYVFRGKIQDDMAMVENDISVILENENLKTKKHLTLGPKINLLIDFVSKEMIVENILREYADIFIKLKQLNKLRNFVVHGNLFVDTKSGNQTILINNNEGLVFDSNLVKEYEELYSLCHKFVLQLHTELGYYDNELEESEIS